MSIKEFGEDVDAKEQTSVYRESGLDINALENTRVSERPCERYI